MQLGRHGADLLTDSNLSLTAMSKTTCNEKKFMCAVCIHHLRIKGASVTLWNNSVKRWPILIIFGTQHHEET